MAAIEDGVLTVAEVGELFGVGERTLFEWKRIQRVRGSLAPLPHRSGNKPRVDKDGAKVVRQIFAEQPDATVAEAAVYFVERTSQPCSASAMVRALARLGLTRKKNATRLRARQPAHPRTPQGLHRGAKPTRPVEADFFRRVWESRRNDP